jgi:4-hydroxy-tetrahydrodipicolinate synthase
MPLSYASSGVFPIAPTPFLPSGEVDFAWAEKLFEFYGQFGDLAPRDRRSAS